jgi:hypothetical protein
MNYYVKRTDESGIEGPFTVEQINQMFKDMNGSVPSNERVGS